MTSKNQRSAAPVAETVVSLARALGRDAHDLAPLLLHAVHDEGRVLTDEPADAANLEGSEDFGGRLDELGPRYEAALGVEDRQSGGVFFTPRGVADGVVAMVMEARAGDPAPEGSNPGVAPAALRALDPSCGPGAFLLAMARAQRARGVAVTDILAGLGGVDIDPMAVALCEATLRLWAAAADPEADLTRGPHLVVGDYLEPPPGGWASTIADGALRGGVAAGVDAVVGNPPFLSQLHQPTARTPLAVARLQERFGAAAKGYGDTAGLFLLAACDDLGPHGTVALIQPVSVLAATGARALREELARRCAVRAMWDGTGRVFDASVDVCAPVLQLRDEHGFPAASRHDVVRRVGMDFVAAPPGDPDLAAGSWAAWLHSSDEVPEVVLEKRQPPSDGLDIALGATTVGELCSATAGFRDQFYGLAPHVVDTERSADHLVPLVTSGLIDPLHNRWGSHEARFAKRRFDRPQVDLISLEADPKLLGWVQQRLVPKVLCATQTRVLEVIPDPTGQAVPSTPVVSVELRPELVERHGVDLATNLITAVLCAPPLSAMLSRNLAGTGLSGGAIRVSATHVEALRLPIDDQHWLAAAELVAEAQTSGAGAPELGEIGERMCLAYGMEAHQGVLSWWAQRLPQRR